MGAPTKNPTGLASSIVFYCKDCHKVAEVKRIGKRYAYTCSACGTKNVAFGTFRSISQYFGVDSPAATHEAQRSELPISPNTPTEIPAPTNVTEPTKEPVKQ